MLGTHNAEVEGSSPSLTTKINELRAFSLRDKNARVGEFVSRNSRQRQSQVQNDDVMYRRREISPVVHKNSVKHLRTRGNIRDAARHGPTWRGRRTTPRGGGANGTFQSRK
jgi:hypothetical protein